MILQGLSDEDREKIGRFLCHKTTNDVVVYTEIFNPKHEIVVHLHKYTMCRTNDNVNESVVEWIELYKVRMQMREEERKLICLKCGR